MLSLKKKRSPNLLLVRVLFLIALDILVINLSAFLALYIRHEFDYGAMKASGFLDTLALFAIPNTIITLGLFWLLNLYSSLWGFAGADELIHIFVAAVLAAAVQAVVILPGLVNLPRSFPVLYAMLLCVSTMVVRFAYRFVRRLRARAGTGGREKTMLIGAGQAGALMLREFKNSSFSRNQVVCIIDDDPGKKGRQLMGVKIIGGRGKIQSAVEKYGITEIILAIPTLTTKAKKEIWEICSHTGCKFKQLPGIYQLANGEVSIQAIRDIDIEDLLERDVVRVDMGGLSDLISGKTVMVTGGGGSIGSELCRQLAGYCPKELVIFDIYENNAYAIEQELKSAFPELKTHVLIGSVRDAARIDSVMREFRPAMVYHAAAHKHVPLMERSPLEAVKNNVFGTYNTARAAAKYGVEHFVLISTDKAVNPTNIMGASKRLCEMVVQMMDRQCPETSFVAVRFGNVLGSNGSVIPLFKKQIAEGGPVTVTDKRIIRYFMTIPEAVSLVLQASYYARGGEIFVLDMGEPVKIDDMARNLIRLSGYTPDVDIKIEYTGLRPGEKLFEELLMDEEGLQETENKMIHIGQPLIMDDAYFREKLRELDEASKQESDVIRVLVSELVPTYRYERNTQPLTGQPAL